MSAPSVCTACGEQLEEGLRFCTSCGTPIEDDAAVARVAETAETEDEDDDVPWELAEVEQLARPASRPEPADVVISRSATRRSPLLPPMQHDEDESDVVISRNWATVARNRTAPNQVGKARKIAGDLPAWEPLPPGEAVVTRRSRKGAAK